MSDDDRKTTTVTINVSAEDLLTLRHAAAVRGQKVSRFVRDEALAAARAAGEHHRCSECRRDLPHGTPDNGVVTAEGIVHTCGTVECFLAASKKAISLGELEVLESDRRHAAVAEKARQEILVRHEQERLAAEKANAQRRDADLAHGAEENAGADAE